MDCRTHHVRLDRTEFHAEADFDRAVFEEWLSLTGGGVPRVVLVPGRPDGGFGPGSAVETFLRGRSATSRQCAGRVG
ncbi:hypothetical protein SAMN04487904_104130 [Actinopolyspora lacussalsi subsp. righensis]|uniref:Uncharacterized protein n=1 Tax=Actinopolyspora righensis TaxID=995060 RepID=A0A1I6Z9Z7_9ACTN|nr:hypothetical protein SAMN04487904_104130 [Actinopolyspora righensis]